MADQQRRLAQRRNPSRGIIEDKRVGISYPVVLACECRIITEYQTAIGKVTIECEYCVRRWQDQKRKEWKEYRELLKKMADSVMHVGSRIRVCTRYWP